MLKVSQTTINENLTIKRIDKDQFGQKRIVVVSDNPDPKEASNETFKTKDILKQKYKAVWDGANKQWYWNDRFKTPEEITKLANGAVKDANAMLGADVSSHKDAGRFEDIEEMQTVKTYLENVKGAYEFVKGRSGKVTLDLLDNYIDQLADSLDDHKLLDDIAKFNKAAKSFILDTGKYSYSFFNTFLIWLQTVNNPNAKEFGSVPYWYGRGYKPKEPATKIFILKPGNTGSLSGNVKRIIKDYPNSPKEYAAESGFKITDPNDPIPAQKYNAFWNWANGKGYVKFKSTNTFNEVAIYDNTNVEPIPGLEQINAPEAPAWFNDSDSEDDKAGIMVEALKRFCTDNGIKVSGNDELGGARGVSYGGHIKLLTNSVGVGLLSTFIHEIAHELLHHPANKELAHGKLYAGRDNTREERELHAESVAYTVMKTYDFPIQHSLNYLAMWKSNKDKIKKFQKLIRETSLYIIQQIEKYAPQVENGAIQNDIKESVEMIKNIISEFKTTISNGQIN